MDLSYRHGHDGSCLGIYRIHTLFDGSKCSQSRPHGGLYGYPERLYLVYPQFIGMLTVPLYYKSVLGDDPLKALVLCGICLFIAAILALKLEEKKDLATTN